MIPGWAKCLVVAAVWGAFCVWAYAAEKETATLKFVEAASDERLLIAPSEEEMMKLPPGEYVCSQWVARQ